MPLIEDRFKNLSTEKAKQDKNLQYYSPKLQALDANKRESKNGGLRILRPQQARLREIVKVLKDKIDPGSGRIIRAA